MKGSGYNCFNRSESDESGRLCLNSNIRKEFCVVDEFEHRLKTFTESDDCLSDASTPKSTKLVQKISSPSNRQNELKTKKQQEPQQQQQSQQQQHQIYFQMKMKMVKCLNYQQVR